MKNIMHSIIFCAGMFLIASCAIKQAAQESVPPVVKKEIHTGIIHKEAIKPYVRQEKNEYMSIDINVLGGTNHSFMNERCSADDSCGLRKFDVREEKCEMPPYKKMSEFFYYTDAFISAKVAPGYANDFSIVQFARGCRWTRYQRSDGTFNMYTDWNKKEFTVIPVGNREEPAHILDKGDYLRILSYGSYFNAKDRIPGVVDGVSYNTAFAFKTCIYKTADVDRELAAKKRYQDMAPLACIDWDSVFVYDFTTHQIREGGDIDAFCGWK